MMSKWRGLAVCAAVLAPVFGAQAAQCPTQIRFVHGHAFEDGAVDVTVNGRKVDELDFREVGRYQRYKPGKLQIAFVDRQSKKVVGERDLTAASGHAYTVVVAGPAKAPEGSLFGTDSPFVFLDDITPPNPGRWKGHWYRMSETNVVIDFRIADGRDPSKEITRLIQKPNRASYQLADLPAGVFQFNPVMPGSSEPFFNTALNPPANVEVAGLKVSGGELVDVFALGNFLGRAPNSLALTVSKFRPELDRNGCVRAEY